MSRAALAFGALLAVVAAALLAFAVYTTWQRMQVLQNDVDYYSGRAAQLEFEKREFLNILNGFDTRDALSAAVQEGDAATRQAIVDNLNAKLAETLAPFPKGAIVEEALAQIVEGAPDVRQSAYDRMYITLFGSLEPTVINQPVVEGAFATVNTVVSLLTALGGVGSGLVSLLVFLVSGRKRDVERELLSVDLEMRRVELAKAQYDAREALSFAQRPPSSS
ncbi:hypothetical protein [Primorskyibacter sp. S187A]|uniref:hypothetical protein n=1 Tax=Primorskyibacter sp. S187A TaxID=3415130 RepID=UPI003C7C2B9A